METIKLIIEGLMIYAGFFISFFLLLGFFIVVFKKRNKPLKSNKTPISEADLKKPELLGTISIQKYNRDGKENYFIA